MSRLDYYGKKYESGQPPEPTEQQSHLQQTNQKKIKYYSNNEYDETIRKKLILDYPSTLEAQNRNLLMESDKQRGQSTKYTTFHQQANNKRLLERLDQSLKTYEPQFRTKKQAKRINFTEFDLKIQLKRQQPIQSFQPTLLPQVEDIASKLQKGIAIQQSERVVQEFLPRHRVNKVNREITELYKENRNVNLQYRRDKFMQIFTGKSHFSKRNLESFSKNF